MQLGIIKEAEKINFSYSNEDIDSISLIWGFKSLSVFSLGGDEKTFI